QEDAMTEPTPQPFKVRQLDALLGTANFGSLCYVYFSTNRHGVAMDLCSGMGINIAEHRHGGFPYFSIDIEVASDDNGGILDLTVDPGRASDNYDGLNGFAFLQLGIFADDDDRRIPNHFVGLSVIVFRLSIEARC